MATIKGFHGDLLSPDHPEYDDARRIWNGEIVADPLSSPAAGPAPTSWRRSPTHRRLHSR